jgi:hypothetical protein
MTATFAAEPFSTFHFPFDYAGVSCPAPPRHVKVRRAQQTTQKNFRNFMALTLGSNLSQFAADSEL